MIQNVLNMQKTIRACNKQKNKKKDFYCEENKLVFSRWEVPFFNVEKCPFSLKSALFFEKKGL